MMDVAKTTQRLMKMENAIKKISGSKITKTLDSNGTTSLFKQAGKNFEVKYGNLVGLAKRVVKNADGDVLTIMEKVPYKAGNAKGLASITKDAKGNVLNWVADFSSDKTRYIMNDKTYPGALQFPKL